jgi:predicted GNAT family N-acyltransferase
MTAPERAMDGEASFDVALRRWRDAADDLRAVRREVFVVEQGVPETLEWDDADDGALHALATDANGRAIGCARLLPDGHIGRVAVRRPWRSRGVGTALLLRLVAAAQARGDTQAVVNAQVAAMAFYERHGFVPSGEVFEEAGIPHRVMTRAL